MIDGLVSIIVPVYNVEKYINRCLKSIVNQTYKNIQIIIVNDGTKDDSISVILDDIKKDDRIEIYEKENGGLSDARNYGCRYAKGEFICFIDSDDWVESDFVQLLINQFKNDDQIDIAIVDYNYEYNDRSKSREYSLEDSVYDSYEALCMLCDGKVITNHVWNKMYRKELFDEIHFEKGRKFEDIYIMHQLFSNSRKISCLSVILYHYYMRDDSIMHVVVPQNDMDIFIGFKNRYDYLDNPRLKKIVLKFCAWSCFKVLFIHDRKQFSVGDLDTALQFWNNHKEITTLGIKYKIMYFFPFFYRFIVGKR